VAMRDPNPMVDGKGISILKKAGIVVATGLLADAARELNAPFIKVHTRGLPYVVVKWAMTADGKIATRTGDSRWVSGEKSRSWLHRFRDTFQAILVGSGTVLRDDPRLRGARSLPARIVLDTAAGTPLDAAIVKTAREQATILAVSPGAPAGKLRELERRGVQVLRLDVRDLRIVFEALAREGYHKILVEGGGEVHASVLGAGLADEVCVFVAPKLVGGREAKSPVEGEGMEFMDQALAISDLSVERIGGDLLLRGRGLRDMPSTPEKSSWIPMPKRSFSRPHSTAPQRSALAAMRARLPWECFATRKWILNGAMRKGPGMTGI